MKKKIKLLFIIPSLGIGGAEVFCANLVSEFSKLEDYDVHLILFFNILSEKYKDQITDNVTIHILNKKPGFSFSFIRKLKKEIVSINPDIINSHSSHVLRYLLLIQRLKKIQLIHTITNNPETYNKYCYPLFKLRMHQKSWSNITFVGISDLVSNNLARVYDYPREKIETIYNGFYQLQKPEKNRDEHYDFFNCANMIGVKRQTLLIRALSKTSTNATLCIAGDGPERDNIISLINELNLEDRVTLKGSVVDPTSLYFCSNCFIMTSSSEGNPISINEAMSAGIPVIAPSVGGIPDLIENNRNGFLFDVNCTSDQIAKLMDDVLMLSKEELEKIKTFSQKKVEKWYMNNILAEYIRLIGKKLENE